MNRLGLRILFGVVTLVFVAIGIPNVLDRANLPPHQADTPQWALVALVVAFGFALAWNAYWFLVGSAVEVRFDGHELRWETGFGSGSMHVQEIIEIRKRVFMPTVYSSTDSVGLFPARGVHAFVDEVVRTRPELRPEHLGVMARVAESGGRRSRLRFE